MKKILVVDDEFLIRYSLLQMLQGPALYVASAATGAEALQELKSVTYDLCFLDVHLPDMTGLEIMKRVRTSGTATKIVMMTGEDLNREMRQDVAGHADLFLAKPFDLLRVRTLVERLLASPAGDAASRLPPAGEQRRRKRLPTALRVSCTLLAEEPGMNADMINESEDGLCLATDRPLAAGCLIAVHDGAFRRMCTVRWTAATVDGGWFAGLEQRQDAAALNCAVPAD